MSQSKTTYIYLNTYPNGYLYVGSHTWLGESGVLDPDYKGSSSVATHFNWSPQSIKILEVVSDERKFIAESVYINQYAELYGIADCALLLSSNQWTAKFKPHGLLLNLHSNSMEQAYTKGLEACSAPDVRSRAAIKAYKSTNGSNLKQTPESKAKSLATRRANGQTLQWSKMFFSAATAAKRDYNAIQTKSQQTKQSKRLLPGYNSRHKVDVYKDSTLLYHNISVTKACTLLGNSSWSIYVNRVLSTEPQVFHHSYLFILLNRSTTVHSMKTKQDIEKEYSPSDWKKFFSSRLSLSAQAEQHGYNYSTADRFFSQCPDYLTFKSTFESISKADLKRYYDTLQWCIEANVVPLFTFEEWKGLVYFDKTDSKTKSNIYTVKCPVCGVPFRTSFRSSIPHLTKCPTCGYSAKGMSSVCKVSVEQRVQSQLKALNLQLLDSYSETKEYHTVKCLTCGCEFSTTLKNNHINKCPYCSESHAQYNQKSKIDKLCAEYNYTFLDEWKGKNAPDGTLNQYKVQCNHCKTTFLTFVDGHQLRLCPKCKTQDYRSNRERKIDSLLSSLNIQHFNNYHFIYDNTKVELDIYCPDQRVAFEFNGYYWHNSGSYPHSKPKDYHQRKTDICLKNGIKLYHIWESTSDELTQSIVLSKLGLCKRVFARKCSIQEIPADVAKGFFTQCHVDGYVRSLVNFALVQDSKIQCCLSLNRRRIQSTGVLQWEIARFASALNTNVVGGYSRLFKQALQYLYQQGATELISYCNRDLSPDTQTTVYNKLGFSFIMDSGPIYKYWASEPVEYRGKSIKRGDLIGRQSCQKTKLLEWFQSQNIKMPSAPSEFSLAQALGFQPCYNSGNFKYSLKLSTDASLSV